jgi:cytoskeletal protein RodZ
MDELEKQGDVPLAGPPGALEPEGETPWPIKNGPARPPLAVMDLARQEKSLEALGRTLKTKREINGQTRRDVVAKIKIPMDQLESIEDGRLSTLPPVFAKGFLRAYANELGLDAEAILDDYRKMTGGFKNEPASRDALASRYVETKMNPGSGRVVIRLLTALALILLGLGAAILLRPDLWRAKVAQWPFLSQILGTAPARPEAETYAPPAEPAASGDPAVAVASGSLAGGNLAASAPVEEGTEPDEAPAPAPPVQPGGELTLISQKDGVWLQLIVDSQPVKHYWLRRGQTVVQRAETDILVRAGQGAALTAVWNGKDLGTLSGQPTVVEASFPPGWSG